MIIIVGKVQVRRDPQALLPGAPISSSPLAFGPGLDIGELGYGEDTARLFIGHSPQTGNPNFNRTVFPYQNVEVLTENSPRNGELFSQFVRDQDRNDFFVPTVIPASYSGALLYTEYDGGMAIPTMLRGAAISATIEYHAFQNDSPIKQGIVRIFGDGNFTQISDTENLVKTGGSLIDFSVNARNTDSEGYFFQINVVNHTSTPITLLIRRAILVGQSA
jgi:hypothetical protein